MKKVISVLLVLSFVLFILADESELERGAKEAEKYANYNANSAMWGLIGFGSGCLLSGIGCLASSLVAFLLDPGIPVEVMDESSEFLMAFKSNYQSSIRQKRALSTFIGGAIGTLVLYVAYVFLIGTSSN